MTDFVRTAITNHIGIITLDRPKALNSLSLEMVRAITQALLAWRGDAAVRAVLIRSSSEKAFCAGGDIRFFHEAGRSTPLAGSALLEDFFTEEYALNHLIHTYPKPYIAIMDGIVMGGGMGIAQGGEGNRMRVVTERTKMAMPEVNIGLFPDVGGSYFLSRCPGQIGAYLGVTGEVIGAADALHAGLADVYVPSSELGTLVDMVSSSQAADLRHAILEFAAPFQAQAEPAASTLAAQRGSMDRHFAGNTVQAIAASLAGDDDAFAQKTLSVMRKRSPLMMCVTLEQLRRGAALSVAECLRMERTMVRRSFENGEVLEGIRSVVIDKDNAPKWQPASLDEVDAAMVERFFAPAWPPHAHPLRELS
ncbi:enoyl-CoA hydratase/isomerase family protein [Noviherbaspirillum sp. CPCC 100848]|uniref:Enoyl-CoA hydratase/isomerase family protein n=1 Tax=Noviherbaspirillum album TaxID=3080276 RepID=A0ABU6JDL2_9BURK|nr:enoyl-CoA hydratase/isomerase family protein [Noviherbaspirillum sp. CPCC 100848]MEC4721533.1 enoyl-CoA hydratase/isomerase family protein [Noviherbaspirillum sp. CPCC 100848]